MGEQLGGGRHSGRVGKGQPARQRCRRNRQHQRDQQRAGEPAVARCRRCGPSRPGAATRRASRSLRRPQRSRRKEPRRHQERLHRQTGIVIKHIEQGSRSGRHDVRHRAVERQVVPDDQLRPDGLDPIDERLRALPCCGGGFAWSIGVGHERALAAARRAPLCRAPIRSAVQPRFARSAKPQSRFIQASMRRTSGRYGGTNRPIAFHRDCHTTGLSLLNVSKPQRP